ncbi:MAG TPA: DUF6600 domain-containing protein [Bauldia sp.]|nr:DUF6600 domain-containing protein [Bauldia sp.]
MPTRPRLPSLAVALLSGAASVLLALDESRAQEARAAYGYVTANLNQRAGPGTQYPAMQVIPARSQVTINGCLPNLAWCEGVYGETHGWMSARYLRLYDYTREAWVEVDDYARSTRLATYTFDLEGYWYAYYRDRPFYPQRAAWLVPRAPVIDTGVFYRELSPYGRWVLLEGRYVWMPEVGPQWRPYTDGRWEYTRRYGWTWVSNEPFGWATYHYGRWAYSARLGWVWVPGTQWAPAWVAWRGSEDHLAWAPLPPDAGPGFVLDDGFDQIPGYYWQVVPAASFLLPNLVDAILRDEDERRPSLERARPIGNVRIENNVVVNNVINIEYVEQKTKEQVVPREVVITNEAARQAETSEEVVRIYQPPVAEAPVTESPPAVLPEEVAAQQSQTAGQAGDEPPTEDRVPEAAEDLAQLPPTEPPPLAEDEPPAEEAPAEEAPPAPAPGEEPAPPSDQPPASEASPPPAPESPPAEPGTEAETPPPAAEEPSPPPAEQEQAPPEAPVIEAPPASDAAPPSGAEEPPPPAEPPPPPPAVEEPGADAEPPPPPSEPPPEPAEERAAPDAAAPPAEPPPAEAPPPPPAEPEAPPPPADVAPPPETVTPPPAEEPPPPPPAAAEEPAPPAEAAPEAAPPAEPPPPAEAAPEAAPPAEPPPPPADQQPAPEAATPPAAEEPPPPPPEEPPPPPAAQEQEAEPQAGDCPEGMRMNRKGDCVPRGKQKD